MHAEQEQEQNTGGAAAVWIEEQMLFICSCLCVGYREDWSGETGDERLAFESQMYSGRLHEGGEKTSASNWLTITHEAFAQISGRRKRADKKTIS